MNRRLFGVGAKPGSLEATTIRSLLRRRAGLDLPQFALGRVAAMLRHRADEVAGGDVDAYVQRLNGKNGAQELQRLINLVTVPKTSFYRHPEQVRALVSNMIPALHRVVESARPISIWCAACSTGEEPYTIAMALEDSGWFARRPFEILATDINTDSLERARAGRFQVVSDSKLPSWIRSRLTSSGPVLCVDPTVQRRIRFAHRNLVAEWPVDPEWHIVLCANVLIYFEPATASAVLDRLERSMAPRGFLMVGGSESLSAYGVSLPVARFGNAYACVRGDWGGIFHSHPAASGTSPESATPTPTATSATPGSSALASASTVPPQTTIASYPESTVSTAAVSVAGPRSPTGVGGRSEPQAASGRDPGPESLALESPVSPIAASITADLEVLARKVVEGGAQEAIRALTQLRSRHAGLPGLERLLGLVLFRERRFTEAKEALEAAVEGDPLAFDLYFHLGCIYQSLGWPQEAVREFRRALFLEPRFMLARYELALALHLLRDLEAAVREYHRAEDAPPDPQLRDRFIGRLSGLGEELWIDESHVVELCRANMKRAVEGLPPLGVMDRS